jgi:hypothetical protein
MEYLNSLPLTVKVISLVVGTVLTLVLIFWRSK